MQPKLQAQTYPHAGLELFVLEALRDIGVKEEITMDYDANASPTKKQGLTFWQWKPQTVLRKKEGFRRIMCSCSGDKRVCPNKLWRDECSAPIAPIPQRAMLGVSPMTERIRPEVLNKLGPWVQHQQNLLQAHNMVTLKIPITLVPQEENRFQITGKLHAASAVRSDYSHPLCN